MDFKLKHTLTGHRGGIFKLMYDPYRECLLSAVAVSLHAGHGPVLTGVNREFIPIDSKVEDVITKVTQEDFLELGGNRR